MEHGNHCSHAIDELKSERQVHKHSRQRVGRSQHCLLAELSANLRPNNRYVIDTEIGEIETLLQGSHDRGINHSLQITETREHAALSLVAIISNLLRDGRVLLLGVSAQVQRIGLQQIGRKRQGA